MILVTGGSGLLGRELIFQLISQGNNVTALYNTTPVAGISSPLFSQIQCNLFDITGLYEAMQGTEKVYHCAAMVSFNPKDKYKLFKSNIEGTANIVNAAIETGVRKIVHVSSVAALGRLRQGEIISEKMKWAENANNSNYGKSKHLAEMEIWRGIGEGLEAVIINPTVILGPGDWDKGSTGLFKSAYNQFPWYTDSTGGFVDVRDVAKAMILLMESNIVAERFIISSENRSFKDLFSLMAMEFNKKAPYKKVTRSIAETVWRWEALKSFFSGKAPLITKETAAAALSSVVYDNSLFLRKFPGFHYRTLEETIAYTCNELTQKYSL